MSCVGLLAMGAGAAQHSSPSTDDCRGVGDHALAQCAQPSRMIGGLLMMEAALKVDKCLARLQTLQGTVTIPIPAGSTVSACISPAYSRSKSCIGSPKFEREEKEPVIRVHDILRFSEDFTGTFSTLTQEHRGKYLRRLSRSKTEVFDDKKDPRDPHGEWKHWSSPAGDVHKVVSEILMASQIAKEITSMVNACLVHTDAGSSDEEKPARRERKYKHKLKAQTSSSNKESITGTSKRMLRKEDPMHKFRVRTPSDSSTRRHSSANRKEVLYPKSKLTANLIRPVDSMQEISSTERKMQSRRSPRVSVSPRTLIEETDQKSRTKAVTAESSRGAAAATPRASVEESILKSQARITAESSMTAATAPASAAEPLIRTLVMLAGESVRASASPRASILEPVSRTHARVASEPERRVGTAGARLEEAVVRNHARTTVSVESARVERTPRSSAEDPVSSRNARVAASAQLSLASSKLRASDNVPILKKIRTRVAAPPESSGVLETPRPVEDSMLTRIRTRPSVEEPVLRNTEMIAAECARVAGTPRSSIDEPLSKNNLRVAASAEPPRASRTLSTSENDPPALLRIRTTVPSPQSSTAPPTPRMSVEDPVLTRIRARVAAAAEPSVGSVDGLLSTMRLRAGGDTSSKSATTSGMWEAKEITNCFNSPRAIAESSKKPAASPSSSAVKKVRNSRSPPQASQTSVEPRLKTSSISAVQSSTVWRYNKTPSSPINYAMTEALEELPEVANSSTRSRIGRLPQQNVAEEGSSSRIRRAQRETAQQHRIAATAVTTHCTRFPTAVREPVVAETRNVESRIPEITPELLNDTAREDNASTTYNASLIGERNDDWFRKSLEATEINLGPSKLWKSASNKAVLFSNPTFAPASPPGARPSGENERSATPVKQPSPSRSSSATRRVKEWVGNVLHGRRSVSPDITARLGSSTRKVASLSPGRSLPSLITRLPSKRKNASSSAPRANVLASAAHKEVGVLPLPPCRQAQQVAASKLTELPVPARQVMGLRDHKEIMDRQAHQLAAQKLMMVEDWNRSVEPPAPFEKDVGVAYRPGPALYSKRQLRDMDCCSAKPNLKAAESNVFMLDKGVVPHVRFSSEPETVSPLKKEKEIANLKQESGWENEVGVIGVLSYCRSTQDRSLAASKRVGRENLAGGGAAVDSAVQGGGATLKKSRSVGSQRSTSTIRAMSTGKMRTGQSFLQRAKDWMRTQTPFRDRPQKSDFS